MTSTQGVQLVEVMANTVKSVTTATCSSSIITRFHVFPAVSSLRIVFGVKVHLHVSNMLNHDENIYPLI